MKPRFLILLMSALTLIACSPKMKTIMSSGSVPHDQFHTQFPFEIKLGLIIIPVEIKGDTFYFMLDSGAPNVLTNECASAVGLKATNSNTVKGSQGKREKIEFGIIDTVKIGGIEFVNTGTGITDFSKSAEIACLKIDGIIGANLMRKGYWQIDFKSQIITISNMWDSLHVPDDALIVPFDTKWTGTPVAGIKIGSTQQPDITLDLGSNGRINVHHSTYLQVKKEGAIITENYEYGNSGSGIFGNSEVDTTDYFMVNNVVIGDLKFDSTILKSSRTPSSTTIGNKVFRNYTLTFNWKQNKLYLEKKSDYNYSQINHCGFKPSFQDSTFVVGALFNGMDAEKNNLELGTELLSYGEFSPTTIDHDAYCQFILDSKWRGRKCDIKIILDSKESILPLQRTNFLK